MKGQMGGCGEQLGHMSYRARFAPVHTELWALRVCSVSCGGWMR